MTDDIRHKIGYKFKNEKLLERALTHSSYANEHHTRSNERLEFLGDSVLSIIISRRLFADMPDDDEGMLSRIRANLVCEQSLAKVSEKIELGNLIYLGKGEERTGGRTRASIISDAFEAVLAAIYLDSDLETAKDWLFGVMEDAIKEAVTSKSIVTDYKTALQEIVQRGGIAHVTYRLIGEYGEDHNKRFCVCAVVNGKDMEQGEGGSKKDAEQLAARLTIEKHYHESI